MPILKNLDLKVLENSLEISDSIFEGENDIALLTVDFTGCDVDDWVKWLDIRLYDGTGIMHELGTEVVCTYTFPSTLMRRGRMEIQPYAISGDDHVKYAVHQIVVNRSINIVGDPIPDALLVGIQEDISALEADKMEKDGSNSDVVVLTFDNGTTIQIDHDRQTPDITFPDGTTANVPSELWYSQGKATEPIAEGDNVMIAGSQGDHYLVKKAVASELALEPWLYLGVATKSSSTNGWVKITKWGLVNNIDMNSWAYGTKLYYNPVNGGFTDTIPELPNARIKVGMVVKTGVHIGVLLVDVADITLYTNDEIDELVAPVTLPRWDDLQFELTPTRVNPTTTKPDYDYTNLGLLFPRNDTSEKIFIIVQFPHAWKEGSTIYPHIHVRQQFNQQAVFKMDYIWYNIGDPIPSVWTTITLDHYAVPYVSGSLSQVLDNVAGISGAGKTISSFMKCRIYRDDNVYTGDMLADQFDIHIELDAIGSKQVYIK